MLSKPKYEEREQQPYVAIREEATLDALPTTLPSLFHEMSAWLDERGIERSGVPFIRYVVIDMPARIEVDVGTPVRGEVPADERVSHGAFPAGRYVTAIHTGPYDQLEEATAKLLAWADDNGVVWDVRSGENGDEWAARTEFYLTNPLEEPDPQKRETELAFKVK